MVYNYAAINRAFHVFFKIAGSHDRPWKVRNIFGKVRYMSYNGCKSKFDIHAYIQLVKRL